MSARSLTPIPYYPLRHDMGLLQSIKSFLGLPEARPDAVAYREQRPSGNRTTRSEPIPRRPLGSPRGATLATGGEVIASDACALRRNAERVDRMK